MTRPLDVIILGTPFCGSTLLGNALNAHPEVTFVGELNRLPFYKQFEGEHYQEGMYVSECVICVTRDPYECSLWNADLLEQLEQAGVAGSSELLREVVQTPVLLDGSKNARWLQYMVSQGKESRGVRVLHCVRSPFSFAYSHKVHTGGPAWAAGNFWRDVAFDNIRTCSDFGGLPLLTVRYEEFALVPEESLRTICDFLGIDYDPIMLQYWKVPCHPLGGNLAAYVRFPNFSSDRSAPVWQPGIRNCSGKPFGGWHDERWLNGLAPGELTQVLHATGIADVAGLLGYDLVGEAKRYFQRSGPQQIPVGNGQPEMSAAVS